MKQESQSVFYIERMQPIWLKKQWHYRLYYGLIAGPICGLLMGLNILGTPLPFPFIVLMTALIIGPLFGWLSAPETDKKEREILKRIWMRTRQSFTTALENRAVIGIIASLAVGIALLPYEYTVDYLSWSLCALS